MKSKIVKGKPFHLNYGVIFAYNGYFTTHAPFLPSPLFSTNIYGMLFIQVDIKSAQRLEPRRGCVALTAKVCSICKVPKVDIVARFIDD